MSKMPKFARAAAIRKTLGIRVAAAYLRNQDTAPWLAMLHLCGHDAAERMRSRMGAECFLTLGWKK